VYAWRDYIRDKDGMSAVFENVDGDRVKGSDPHRFDPEYADKQYAKLKDLERGVRNEYGQLLHTAMLTFTAASTDEAGDPLPPVDHLDELLSSWNAIRRELDRVLGGHQYERLAILEPHKSGYIHVHMAVFVQGVIDRETFAPVIDAHVRNCDLAGRDAHDTGDRSTISVKRVGNERQENEEIANLGTYLAEYLGTYGDGEGPLDAPEHVQMSNAILWADERQRWRPSNGAQEFMAYDGPDDPEVSDWELVGIEDGDGEFYEVSQENPGGVDRFTTSTVGDDPPGRVPDWASGSGRREDWRPE